MSYLGDTSGGAPKLSTANRYLGSLYAAISSNAQIESFCKRDNTEAKAIQSCIYSQQVDRTHGRLALGATLGVIGLGAWLLLRRRR